MKDELVQLGSYNLSEYNKPKEGIKLQYPELPKETKCKLYIQYGQNKMITEGGRNDLFHGVRLGNIKKLLRKRNQGNIYKIIARVEGKHNKSLIPAVADEAAYILYKAN